MSAETTHTTSPCEALLDFIYDELSGPARQAFETHLLGCASCQAEVAALKHVRGAVKEVLPFLEPPATATGALHAQLMHAAALGRPRRGKVIALFRQVVSHPGYAAAA